MMTKVEYSIARQFSRHPGPRFRHQGPDSGEALRAKLIKLLEDMDLVIDIDLDGTSGFGSSFLDEAFGGLVRKEGYSKDVLKRFNFKSEIDPSYIFEITESIERAEPEH
jgi:STAS-like domain of unknown function (DUF4325)